jgi:pimeloyl-ACP methyl ester carboxylesterase
MTSRALRFGWLLTLLVACGDDDSTDPPDMSAPDGAAADMGEVMGDPDCDPIDPTACALPWPSSLYLEPADTVTGVRLAFGDESLPFNARRNHIAPALFEGLDGYGHGTPIMFDVGPLAFDELPGEWERMGDSVAADSPTLLLKETEDGFERVPHWLELDRNASRDPLTYLRPAVILDPATRYVVALRNLPGADGATIEASDAFAALRDGTASADERVEARRDAMDALFAELEGAGVARDELVLAWDFVTGSSEALHARLDRSIELGFGAAPEGGALTFDEVQTFEPEENERIRYRISATMTVPSVVRERDDPELDAPGYELDLDEDGELQLNGTLTTRVLIHVPHSAIGGDPVGVMVYGHGLFGNEQEIRAGHIERLAEEYGFVVLGVPMFGMSDDDFNTVVAMTSDMNRFVVISDALHQGMLNHHLLARAGQETLAAQLAEEVDDQIAVDGSELVYFGGSQGGIFGQTLLATSPDITRGVMAVPGNNYVTLLQRSVNFSQFGTLLKNAYRNDTNVAIVSAAVQLLWDRTDPVSYVDRMLHGPSFGDPERQALLLLSKGDYQVAVVTNEIAARTWPGELHLMSGYDERIPYGLGQTPYPVDEGSAMILFDFGNPWPDDRGNLPPEDDFGDPHPRIAEVDAAGDLMDVFLREGRVIDICGGDGCNPD